MINAFNDIEQRPIEDTEGKIAGLDDLRRVAAIEVGSGTTAFRSDESGIWLGALKSADAPFKVDMEGALTAKSATFKDDTDTTIIDATGLVSTNNFSTGSVSRNTNWTTTATGGELITNMSLSISLPRSARALISFFANGENDKYGSDGLQSYIKLMVDGVVAWQFDCSGSYHPDIPDEALHEIVSWSYIKTFTSGNHTIQLYGGVYDAGTTLTIGECSMNYIMLGT